MNIISQYGPGLEYPITVMFKAGITYHSLVGVREIISQSGQGQGCHILDWSRTGISYHILLQFSPVQGYHITVWSRQGYHIIVRSSERISYHSVVQATSYASSSHSYGTIGKIYWYKGSIVHCSKLQCSAVQCSANLSIVGSALQ